MKSLTPDETILGLIAARNCHGYELIEIFHDPAQLGSVWQMSTSQIYAVLKRLEREKQIIGHEVETEAAPNRIEYQLTQAGQQQLETWLYDPAPSSSIRRVRVEFLSRLFIARLLNIPTIPIVQKQRAACEAEYASLLAERENLPGGMNFLTHELVIAQIEAVLQWIVRCELVPRDGED